MTPEPYSHNVSAILTVPTHSSPKTAQPGRLRDETLWSPEGEPNRYRHTTRGLGRATWSAIGGRTLPHPMDNAHTMR